MLTMQPSFKTKPSALYLANGPAAHRPISRSVAIHARPQDVFQRRHSVASSTQPVSFGKLPSGTSAIGFLIFLMWIIWTFGSNPRPGAVPDARITPIAVPAGLATVAQDMPDTIIPAVETYLGGESFTPAITFPLWGRGLRQRKGSLNQSSRKTDYPRRLPKPIKRRAWSANVF